MLIEVARDVNLFVQDWGKGKPIMFLHGWPYSHRTMEYQMLQLAIRGYRVIGIDLRGFGYSDKTWDGYDYDTWAQDVGKVIKELNLRDLTLVGFSIGGAIAAHYVALSNDPRVSKLALLSAALPAAAPLPENKTFFEELIQNMLIDHPKCVHNFSLNFFKSAVSNEYRLWLDSIAGLASLRACVRGLAELRDQDLTAHLGDIRVPTLICHGVDDKIIPFHAAEAQQHLIKNSSLVRFENSGHGTFRDEKEKLTDELARFGAASIAKAA